MMRMLSRRIFKLFSGIGLGAISLEAAAGNGGDIYVSWALQTGGSTPVPTLGAYGAGALAVLVAVIMYRVISDNPRLMGALLVAGLSIGTVTGAIWMAPSIANGVVTDIYIPADADCNTRDYSLYDGEVKALTNNCAKPVTVTYEVLGGFCGNLPALECYSTAVCVENGGSIRVGETKQLLSCLRPPD